VKVATALTASRGVKGARSPSLQQLQDRATDGIVPGMSDHPRAKALAPPCQQTEHQAVNANQQHAWTAFVTMRGAKYNRRQQHSGERRGADGGELPLQVSAKNDLFADSRRSTHAKPHQQFHSGAGNKEAELLRRLSNLPASSRCINLAPAPSTVTAASQKPQAMSRSRTTSSAFDQRPPINWRMLVLLRIPRYTKPVRTHSHPIAQRYCRISPVRREDVFPASLPKTPQSERTKQLPCATTERGGHDLVRRVDGNRVAGMSRGAKSIHLIMRGLPLCRERSWDYGPHGRRCHRVGGAYAHR